MKNCPAECICADDSNCSSCLAGNCCCTSTCEIKTPSFLKQVKRSYPSAVGIMVLCITSSQIGQNISFLVFGYHDLFGIVTSYVLGYGLASLTTFCTIIGRYDPKHAIGGCCSALEQVSNIGFVSNLKNTFRYCGIGIKKMPDLIKLPNARNIIVTSIYILITAESACILTAETINLAFFRHAMWLSMPLGLFAGAFVVTIIETYKMRRVSK